MISPAVRTCDQLSNQQLRRFGLTVGGLVALILGGAAPWFGGDDLPAWPWVAGALLCLWSLGHPRSLRVIYIGWMAAGKLLGWINTRIILGLVFLALFVPMGFLLRLTGNRPLERRPYLFSNSYLRKSAILSAKNMENPY